MTKKKKVSMFGELQEALRDAVAYERGGMHGLRVSELAERPKPMSRKEVAQIRKSLGVSQVVFAKVINVSPNAVRSWEQGTRRPTAATLKLLTVAKEHPEALLKKRA
jgi:putative transcriptional regulator